MHFGKTGLTEKVLKFVVTILYKCVLTVRHVMLQHLFAVWYTVRYATIYTPGIDQS